jgi:hypothetical protein
MTKDELTRDFWGLGFSKGRNDPHKIGEKGHGTKIYLRSESVRVVTTGPDGTFESVCERPMRDLSRNRSHKPVFRPGSDSMRPRGTLVEIVGYNQNERSLFIQSVAKDYIQWFSKFGSIERIFGIRDFEGIKLYLKCLDVAEFEEIPFGHPFPEENSDIDALFKSHGPDAADHFVRRYKNKNQGRLTELPEVTYDWIVSIEGDQAKRSYNKMLGERRRKDTGRYRVGDRYGLWLCKDFIPIQRINDWIVSFGTGSNSVTLIHGFINCQRLKLTANRGSIANTDPKILEELRKTVQVELDTINSDLRKKGIFTLFEWQSEEKTLQQEKEDYDARTKSLVGRKAANLDKLILFEPRNEAELFGLFTKVYTVRPELFGFEPLDYSTSRGIDIIARNITENKISESSLWYIELKNVLRRNLNHGFKFLRVIICWDFDSSIKVGSEFTDVQESEVRYLEINKSPEGHTVYYLNSKTSAVKIEVIRLQEFLAERLGIEFRTDV